MKNGGAAQQFSIKDLEHFTGVKAHTIRMWEQRYELLDPQRTSTNIRHYTGEDLKKLLNVRFLLDQGLKISKIAKLNPEELIGQVDDLQTRQGLKSTIYHSLKMSMIHYDEALYRSVVEAYTLEHGLDRTFLDVFLPFLSEIGVLWLTNAICPAQEHFISNLMRQTLNAGVQSLPAASGEDADVVVLYLPEREIHDISLLFLHYLCSKRGLRSIFLGASVPFEDLINVAAQFPEARFVSYCTTHPSPSNAQDYVQKVQRQFAGSANSFCLGGKMFEGIESTPVVQLASDGGGLVSLIVS
jgi:MerR family transcriptional regulator, light-induced transcriptional regulator